MQFLTDHVLDADKIVVDEEQVGPPLLQTLLLERWGPVGAVCQVNNQAGTHRQHHHVRRNHPESKVEDNDNITNNNINDSLYSANHENLCSPRFT